MGEATPVAPLVVVRIPAVPGPEEIRAADVPNPVGAKGSRGPLVAFAGDGDRGSADAPSASSARTSPATS
ncbi:hypothetical protein [Streptomyces sp. NPDC059010]|uniref:hypothetical protein n=1 Tax=Streptomyces sp. NPDC059010 TaxID=3346695 RepID=UPI0036B17383